MEAPEIPEKTKAELFVENPDRFVSLDTIVCAVGRSDKGMTMFIQPRNRAEIVQAFGELQLAMIAESIRFNDILKQARRDANPGMINGVRKIFGRG